MTSSKQLDIQFEDHQNRNKWCYPLREDVFATLASKDNPTVHKIFGAGSFFSPLLFGKFFDPSDAFPLWEFDPNVLLPNMHSTSQRNVDWFQTDTDYVLKAQLPAGTSNNTVQVCIENGKILEINGQWRQQKEKESRTKDWKMNHWWEHGYVRRLELPDQADSRNSEAHLKNDFVLEIKVPKIAAADSDKPQQGK